MNDTQPILFGRQRALEQLWSWFELARRGRLQVILVAGDPGIGKTRLLEALAVQARQAGAIILQGGASEAEGMPPYLPFLEALSPYIRSTPLEILQAQTGPLTSILVTIFPELSLRLGDVPSGYALPPEQARLRLFEAVCSFLAAIATYPFSPPQTGNQAGVLILDDLHWADPASLDLLCYLARHQPNAPLLLVGAYREGETGQSQAFQRTLTELTRLRVLTTLKLKALSTAEIAALAANYLQAPVEPKLSQLLYRQSEGSPFFAEELLRGWLESGAIAPTNSGWSWGGQRGELLPATIVSAVRQRLSRLPLETVEYLRTAAIMGRTFKVAFLAEVLGQPEEVVEEALQIATQARLIRPEQPGAFIFSHDLIRECLYDEVTAARRKRLHGLIGQVLETRPPQAGVQHLADLAFHFTRSGDQVRGATYARQAAEQALQAYAPAEAVGYYQTALSLLHLTDPQRGHLLVGLGEAALLAGNEREAATAFETAQAWFTQVGDHIAAARAAQRLGQAFWRLEALLEARRAFESALALLNGPRRVSPAMVQVLVDLGSLLVVSLHQQVEGLAYGQQALELAQQLEDDQLIAMASRTVGNLLVRANNLRQGVPLLEQALSLATASDDPVEGSECCACLAIAYAWSTAAHHLVDLTPRWLEFAQRCHDLYQLRHIYSFQAVGEIFLGRWAAAQHMIVQAQMVVERLASPEPLAFLDMVRGLLAYHQGDYATAEALLAKAVATFRVMGPGALVWYLGWLGLAQAAQGKTEAASACMAELERLMAGFPARAMPTAEALAHLTMLALTLNEHENLIRYYPRLLPFRGQFHDALIDRLLGEIEVRQGNWPAAQASLAAAETIARRESFKIELAQTLVAQADLELARKGRGIADRGKQLMDEATFIYQELGNVPQVQHLRERVRHLSSRRDRLLQSALPAGLSQREVEVLRLVAAGKSNRQIAEALVLSEKTVANHLTHIFNKIAVDNRAAATAFAIRHKLV
jgi:DNA-binding CsgD family transcriptional regulator